MGWPATQRSSDENEQAHETEDYLTSALEELRQTVERIKATAIKAQQLREIV